jgi:hypothetical protein
MAGYYLTVMFPKFIETPKTLDAGRNGWSSIARCETVAKTVAGEKTGNSFQGS